MGKQLEALAVKAVSASWRLYKAASFTAHTEIAGQSFRVPISDGRGLSMLAFSPAEARLVQRIGSLLQERPGAILDVGANTGRFLIYSAAANRKAAYLGFDVHAACVAYMQRIIDLNDLRGFAVFAIGLTNRTGVMTLRSGSDDDVSATLTDGHYPADMFARARPMCVARGDDIVGDIDLGPISLLKIDVEGGELEVVQGLAETIAKHKPSILVEVAPYAYIAEPKRRAFRQERARRLDALLKDHGYQFAKLCDGGNLTPVAQLDPGDSTDYAEMDYLCTIRS